MIIDDVLAEASKSGARVSDICHYLGVRRGVYLKARKEHHWLSDACLLEAARRCVTRHGGFGLQTDLECFTGAS